jgi:hypothetical protein
MHTCLCMTFYNHSARHARDKAVNFVVVVSIKIFDLVINQVVNVVSVCRKWKKGNMHNVMYM